MFDQIKHKIYPWVKLKADGGSGGEELTITADIPAKDLIADLVAVFAIDRGDNFEIVQRGHLPPNLTDEELASLALENLARDIEFKVLPTSFNGFGLLADGDHEAGALCLNYIWEFCAGQLNDNLIIAVPAKDMVLVAAASCPEDIETMAKTAQEIYENGERILTSRLLRYNRDDKSFAIYK